MLRSPLLWVVLVVAAAFPVTLWLLRPTAGPLPVLGRAPEFELVSEAGEPFDDGQLDGAVYVANFFFTRCTTICPMLTRSMARLQDGLDAVGDREIRLISFSVDPGYDRPAILASYAEGNGADPTRWSFLTGDPEKVRAVVEGGFKTAMGDAVIDGAGMLEIAHTGKFVLVDRRGWIRGYFDSDPAGLDELLREALRLVRTEH